MGAGVNKKEQTEQPKNTGPLTASFGDGYSDVVNRVFHLELLREIILKHVVYGSRGNERISNIRSIRLVNKAWLQSTSKILLKSQQSLFKFRLGTFPPDKTEYGDKLNKFLSSEIGGTRLEDGIPPHSIRVSGGVFCPETPQNLKSLLRCFETCGRGLVGLRLEISSRHNHFMLQNTNFLFPKLRNFELSFYLIPKTPWGAPRDFSENTAAIQNVLDSSRQLKSFVISTSKLNNKEAESLRDVILPTSITDLNFDCLLNERALLVLAQNQLPNLKKLKFIVAGLPFEKDGIITMILQNFRKTLEELYVRELTLGCVDERNHGPTSFQLPLMEKLESLRFKSEFVELQGNPSSLERFLPKVKQVTLANQTFSRFQKWMDQSCFHSVTSVTLHLSLYKLCLNDDYYENFDLPMRALKSAFPNVQKLDITFHKIDPAFVVLWELKKLTTLRISIRNSVELEHYKILEALLIGIPVEDVPKLKNYSESWMILQNRNTHSIRNLTDLHTLAIDTYSKPHLMWNMAFNLAFFKMPKLTKLILARNLFPTNEIVEKWTMEGRTIIDTYHPTNFRHSAAETDF